MQARTQISLAELAQQLGGRLEGDGRRIVRGVGAIDASGPDDVTFLANARYERYVPSTKAAAVIVAQNYAGPRPESAALIRCQDPYFAFRQAMVLFYGWREHPFEGIDPRAGVDPSATIGQEARIGPFAVVCAGATIGPRSVLYPGVFVGPQARLGADCILYPNAVIYDRCILGDRVTVHACSSIGHDGFGYATHQGRHEKIPAAGWVEIGDDCEIGAGCAIDRASLGATVIGSGTKFSNLIAIGHGTRMGKGCLMVAQAGIAGSTTVGDYCVFAGQSGVVGHKRLGDFVKVGAQAGVAGDVPAGQEVLGSPAVPLPEARRAMIAGAKLPEMRSQIKQLQRLVQQLQQRLDQLQGGRGPKEQP